MKSLFIFLLVSTFLSSKVIDCFGQPDSTSNLVSVSRKYLSSPLRYYYLADSYSRHHDTIKTEFFLLKTNPYYLLWEWRNTSLPDSILSKFALSPNARKVLNANYTSALKEPKTKAYTRFENMAIEDQKVRNQLSECIDSADCSRLSMRMRKDDSAHFNFLYSYVSKNGWPSIKNGSLNACLIAIHDHEHHNFYLPYISKAVEDGQAPLSTFRLITYWNSMSLSNKMQQKIIDTTTKKYAFNITEVLSLRLPYSLQSIQTIIKKHCPVKLRFVFYANTPSIFDQWFDRNPPGKKNHVMTRLIEELSPDCPQKIEPGVWDIRYQPSDQGTKLMLYVLY